MGNSTAKTKRIDVKLESSDLIVLGLPYKTGEKQLREYFNTFGPLIKAKIRRDPRTGHSKGFGFIQFKNYDAQEKALSENHTLEGTTCHVKLFNAKEVDLTDKDTRKIFVGGITVDITGDDLRDHFSAYGAVTNVFIPKLFRAFAFVTFLDPEVAHSMCGEAHVVKDVTVQVSSASRKFNQNRRAGGGWAGAGSAGGAGQGQMRRNVQGARPMGQGTGVNGQNLLNVATVPMNAALIAAALTQVGWSLANGMQGNLGLGGGGGGVMNQNPSSSQGGMQNEPVVRNNEGQKTDVGNVVALGWHGSQESDSEIENVASQQ